MLPLGRTESASRRAVQAFGSFVDEGWYGWSRRWIKVLSTVIGALLRLVEVKKKLEFVYSPTFTYDHEVMNHD